MHKAVKRKFIDGKYNFHIKQLKKKVIKKCRKELDYNRAVFFMIGALMAFILAILAICVAQN
ncbi:MAG TPA: hypothetical protein DGG95_02510 [Cytophagales bacterium]|jgi:hypothetical protein|nr:hypothetical protein [Cytophagales bacterium]